jgi:hypothetical protein
MSRLLVSSALSIAACWMLERFLAWRWGFVLVLILYGGLFLGISLVLKSWKVQDFDAICSLVDRTSLGRRGWSDRVRVLRNKFAMR